ncbi:MAG: hypothetical protein RR850_08720 [Hafnia sp.]|nr:hypothetical protein [Hafnia paralvei]MCE9948063.1 hypothetical protein [Hafnia paralvei]MDU1192740.1 hypothetical protein [Enterobacteriaceae bacterium]MDU1246065.1 hypothetical protein [Enterobacteriaceae bacterium]
MVLIPLSASFRDALGELADEALEDPPDCLPKEAQCQGIGGKRLALEK